MTENPPTVVIVGAGSAGTNAAKALDEAPVKVVMLDRNNRQRMTAVHETITLYITHGG